MVPPTIAFISSNTSNDKGVVLTAWRDHALFCKFLQTVQKSSFIANKSHLIAKNMHFRGWKFVSEESETVDDEKIISSFINSILDTWSIENDRSADEYIGNATFSANQPIEGGETEFLTNSEQQEKLQQMHPPADTTRPSNGDLPSKIRYPRRNSIVMLSNDQDAEESVRETVLANAILSQEDEFQRMTEKNYHMRSLYDQKPRNAPLQGILKRPFSSVGGPSARRVSWRLRHNDDGARRFSFIRETQLASAGPSIVTLSGLPTSRPSGSNNVQVHPTPERVGRRLNAIVPSPMIGGHPTEEVNARVSPNISLKCVTLGPTKNPLSVVSPAESESGSDVINLGIADKKVKSIFLDHPSSPSEISPSRFTLAPKCRAMGSLVGAATSCTFDRGRTSVLDDLEENAKLVHTSCSAIMTPAKYARSPNKRLSSRPFLACDTSLFEHAEDTHWEEPIAAVLAAPDECHSMQTQGVTTKHQQVTGQPVQKNRLDNENTVHARKRRKTTFQVPLATNASIRAGNDPSAEPFSRYRTYDVLFCGNYTSEVRNHPGNAMYFGHLLQELCNFDRLHPNDKDLVASEIVETFVLGNSHVRFLLPVSRDAQQTIGWKQASSEEVVQKTRGIINTIRADRMAATTKMLKGSVDAGDLNRDSLVCRLFKQGGES